MSLGQIGVVGLVRQIGVAGSVRRIGVVGSLGQINVVGFGKCCRMVPKCVISRKGLSARL